MRTRIVRSPASGFTSTISQPVRCSTIARCSTTVASVSAMAAAASASFRATESAPANKPSSARVAASRASAGASEARIASTSAVRVLSAPCTAFASASRASIAARASSKLNDASEGWSRAPRAASASAPLAAISAASAALSSSSSLSTRVASASRISWNATALCPTSCTSFATSFASASLRSFKSLISADAALNSALSRGGARALGNGRDSKTLRRNAASVPSSMVPNFSRLTLFLMRSRSASELPSAFSWAPSTSASSEFAVWSSSLSASRNAEAVGAVRSWRMASPLRNAPGECTDMSSNVSSRVMFRVFMSAEEPSADGPTATASARGCARKLQTPSRDASRGARCARHARSARKARVCHAPGRNAWRVRALRSRVCGRRADGCARRVVRGGPPRGERREKRSRAEAVGGGAGDSNGLVLHKSQVKEFPTRHSNGASFLAGTR